MKIIVATIYKIKIFFKAFYGFSTLKLNMARFQDMFWRWLLLDQEIS